MSTWTPGDNIDEEDDEGDEFIPSMGGREGTIYLVDANLFSNEEHFRLCLQCIEASMLSKVLTNHKDLVGVIFYNTEKNPPPKDNDADADTSMVVPENTAIFMPLRPLDKEPIQYFKHFKDSIDFFDFENRYGQSKASKFSEALWLCSRHFMHCSYKLMNSTIYIFTNNEEPHSSVSSELQQTFLRAKDLHDNDVSVVLVPLIDEFDVDKFYKEFLCTVEDIDPEGFRYVPPAEQRDYLINRVYQRDYRKNCLRHIKFTLNDGLDIGCGVYGFTKSAKIPNAVKMFRDTNETVISKRNYVAEEYNEENETFEFTRKMLPGETFKCQEIGGKEIIFSSEELTKIQSLNVPGLTLLGFKPLEILPLRYLSKKVAFLYPDENTIKGSAKLFRALWEKCHEKNKFALCVLTYRRKVPPRYVVLVPQTEETDGNAGFKILYMPMDNDLNYYDFLEREPSEVTDTQLKLMEKLGRKLKFRYCLELFSDPNFLTFYAQMEALVFDEPGANPDDTTLPNIEHQDRKLTDYVEEITNGYGSDSVKRSLTEGGSDGGSRAKAPRKELTNEDIEQAVENGRETAVTVQHLKDYLKSKGHSIPSQALKKDLIELVRNNLQ